jgi:uncharacterized protein
MNNIKKQGFGSMSPEKRRALQSKGGINAHKSGRAHEWDSKSASLAGKLGARKRHERQTS